MPTNRRRIAVTVILVAFLILIPSGFAHAGLFDIGSIASGVIGSVVFAISYIINSVIGIALSCAGYLVDFTLHLNDLILDSSNTMVQVGWAIVRDVANLGFVLVIVVIAFATILRLENYNARKLLPRLIAAAILVNFSLQIAGFVIGFSKVITDFFLDSTLGHKWDMATIVTSAFSPQRLFLTDQNPPPPEPGEQQQAGVVSTISATVLISIASLIFSAVFLLIATFVMAGLAFMLLLRYVWLSFLLIVAPITWLFWVIPALQGQFSKWWSKFFQWTFFAPAVSFFIYISIIAAQKMGAMTMGIKTDFLIPSLGTIVIDGAQMVVVAGIMLGGLIAAQSMGIAGAAGTMKLLQGTGKGVTAWAGRRTKQAGAAGLALAGKPVANAMLKIPGLRKFGMQLGGQSEVMRSQLISDADGRLKQYSDAHLAKNLGALTAPERVAAMERLAKNGTSGLIERNGKKDALSEITDKNRKLFETYGQKKQWGDFELASGMNLASANALRKGPAGEEELKAAMAGWIGGLKPDQIAKLPTNDFFKGKGEDKDGKNKEIIESLGPTATKEMSDSFREALVRGIALRVPGDVMKLFSKVKGVGFEQLYSTVEEVAGNFKTKEDKEDITKTLVDVLKKAPSLRYYSGMYEEGGGTASQSAASSSAPKS